MKNSYYDYDGNGRVVIPSNSIINTLPDDGGEYWNRLVFEKSPYLLQHAANPVDWYPWGEEAFNRAINENKPIFLSIGYTTCHWCHVMEHESFEDQEVAQLLNEYFIPVKVDREERPDVDNVYMEVTQIINGRGGWPMTVIMTPDKLPFFAGTYFPKETKYRRIGMLDLLPQINDYWNTKQDSLIADAKNLTLRLQNRHKSGNSKGSLLSPSAALKNTYARFESSFDSKYGGFGKSPKFPKPHDYLFLLKYSNRDKDSNAIHMATKSLREMRMGGLFDQIGFGFHRYSTDSKWLVPHFEKMLYDQALLIHAYLEAYIHTQDNFFKQVVEEIIEYVLRDMTSQFGGFYSAEDADSEGEEGLFYLWTIKEIRSMLNNEDAEYIIDILNMNEVGNWHDGKKDKTNIPHFNNEWDEISKKYKQEESILIERYNLIREKLFTIRKDRIHPQKDDKILTDWNGLMISALAKSASVLNSELYKDSAIAATDFILNNLRSPDGGLFKRYRNGESGLNGLIEDYSFFIWGLIEMYQLTFDTQYLEIAIELSDYQIKNFWDNDNFGFYFTPLSGEELIVRSKESYDGAIPSGNSVAAYNFIRLGRIISSSKYEKISTQITNLFSKNLNNYGSGYTMMLQAVEFMTGPSYEILIIGDYNKSKKLINQINQINQPNKVLIYVDVDTKDNVSSVIPFIKMYPNPEDKHPMVYVCKNYSCNLPTYDIKEIRKQLLE